MCRNETVVLTLARLFFSGIFLFCRPHVLPACGSLLKLPLESRILVEATARQASRSMPMCFVHTCFDKCAFGTWLAGTHAALKWLLYIFARNCNHLFLRNSIYVIVLHALRYLFFILQRCCYFCSVLLSDRCWIWCEGVWSRVDTFLFPINKYLLLYQAVPILRPIWY